MVVVPRNEGIYIMIILVRHILHLGAVVLVAEQNHKHYRHNEGVACEDKPRRLPAVSKLCARHEVSSVTTGYIYKIYARTR